MEKVGVGGQNRSQMMYLATSHSKCFSLALRLEQPHPELGEGKPLPVWRETAGDNPGHLRILIRYRCMRPKLTDQSVTGHRNSNGKGKPGKSQ